MDWTKLTKQHQDRPGGSAGMIAGTAAKQRLAGEAPGAWTIDPKLGHPHDRGNISLGQISNGTWVSFTPALTAMKPHLF
jgi:hypothetical protein